MVSVASTSANMDLTAVLPALMEGIDQEVGVDINELKVYIEIGLKQDAPLLQSYNTSQTPLRSRLLCPMEGVFKAMSAHLLTKGETYL